MTGAGWKPVELDGLAGSTPAPSAVAGSGAGFRRQTVNLFDGGSIPLGHPPNQAFGSGAVEQLI